MSDEQEYSVQDLISLSYDQKPIDFQNAFNSIIKDRLADAVSDKKLEMAQTVFTGPDDHLDDDDDNAEIEDEMDLGDDEQEYEFDDELDQEENQNGETA